VAPGGQLGERRRGRGGAADTAPGVLMPGQSYHKTRPDRKRRKPKARIRRAPPVPGARRPADDGLIQIEVRRRADPRLGPGIIWSIHREPIHADDGGTSAGEARRLPTIAGTRFTLRKLTWDLPLEQHPPQFIDHATLDVDHADRLGLEKLAFWLAGF